MMKTYNFKREIIHKVFVKYDLIWVISKWFSDDEYQLEESYLEKYTIDNPNAIDLDIYNELVRIIKDWFWTSSLNQETLNILRKMAEEIYIWIKNYAKIN